jgi:hypothetical protein
MEWTRSQTLALATPTCRICFGGGLKWGRKGALTPCNCVLRSIFRACFAKFRYCVTKEKHLSRVTLEVTNHGSRRAVWGRKDEEYSADFFLVTRRTLAPEEYRLFRLHFLLGADWKLCCRKLQMDRGNFFHAVYRIEQKLGRTFRELQPYALFPLDEYFASARQPAAPSLPPTPSAPALRFPLRPLVPLEVPLAA